jgi:hypothetical protein
MNKGCNATRIGIITKQNRRCLKDCVQHSDTGIMFVQEVDLVSDDFNTVDRPWDGPCGV